jgi:CDP-diacylglycerol--glycerol-3-phosphate 3-phosphatidyltransferase
MPSIYDLKPAFQSLLRPLLQRMAGVGVTANQVTLAALLMSIATGAAVALWPVPRTLLLLPAVLFMRMALNAIDGMLAREFNQKSRLGAILNELGDVLSDTAIYLPLALVPGISVWLMFGIVLLSTLSEMTGVLGLMIGASRRYDGPMGKSDRAFLFGALGLGLGFGVKIGAWLSWLLIGVMSLLLVTIFNRAHRALKEHS